MSYDEVSKRPIEKSGRTTPQQVGVEYDIDAEDEFRYDFVYNKEIPGNKSPNALTLGVGDVI